MIPTLAAAALLYSLCQDSVIAAGAAGAAPPPPSPGPVSQYNKTFSLDGIGWPAVARSAPRTGARALRVGAIRNVEQLYSSSDSFGWRQPALRGLTPFEFVISEAIRSYPGVDAVRFVVHETTTYNSEQKSTVASRELVVGGASPHYVLNVERFLAEIAKRKDDIIQIRLLAIDLGAVGDVSNKSERKAVIDTSDANAMEAAARAALDRSDAAKNNKSTDMRLQVRAGEEGALAAFDQRSFVTDYEVNMADGAYIADPVVEVIQTGIFISATAVVNPARGGRMLDAFVSIQTSDYVDSKSQSEITVLGSKKVTIQTPQTIESTWNSGQLAVADGSSLRISGLKRVDETTGFHAMEYWIGFKIVNNEKPAAANAGAGSVIATDPAGRTVVIKFAAGRAAPKTGEMLKIIGGGASLRVESVHGDVAVCAVTSGAMPSVGESVE
ncbi:MAG: hypothetical protein HY286_02495 [Planctomycetes bacterium]|nr:hypothetical protein [Planctomycetota bacterium]